MTSAEPRAGKAVALAVLLLALGAGQPAWGHGDVHQQIEQVTAQLQQHPDDVELLLRRARLHQAHADWAASAADFDRAEVQAPALATIWLARGQMLLAAGRLDEARREVDKFASQKPDVAEGWLTRARVGVKQGRPLDAIADFHRALELPTRPEPEHYLEYAQALTAVNPSRRAEAVDVLDQGLTRLGNLPALGLPAVDLEVQLQRYDAALARLRRLGASSPRPETWLDRQGDVLLLAGRPSEAAQCFRTALETLARRSVTVRARAANQQLQASLEKKLIPLTPRTATATATADRR